MSKVLITQIGSPKTKDGDYVLTCYELDGKRIETPMISYGLIEVLNPDSVVFLGTSGSSWSSLLRMAATTDEALEEVIELWSMLEEKEKEDSVVQSELSSVSVFLSQYFKRRVKCVLTPYLEQYPLADSAQYLRLLADSVNSNDQVSIDVTHGMRYHPMLSLLAAQYLKSVQQIEILDILYGAFDRSKEDPHTGQKITPVLRLEGLLNVLDWITALSSYDKDGDYSVFSELMAADKVPEEVCNAIEQASFFERITAAQKAAQQLTRLSQHHFDKAVSPVAELFAPTLKERISWAGNSSRGKREFSLSKEYLERGDYLRAAIYALEGFISMGLDQQRQDLNDYFAREDFSKSVNDESFLMLKKIRNSLAHGSMNRDPEIQRLFNDEKVLYNKLKALITKLGKPYQG